MFKFSTFPLANYYIGKKICIFYNSYNAFKEHLSRYYSISSFLVEYRPPLRSSFCNNLSLKNIYHFFKLFKVHIYKANVDGFEYVIIFLLEGIFWNFISFWIWSNIFFFHLFTFVLKIGGLGSIPGTFRESK